jgi:hypothetical protein
MFGVMEVRVNIVPKRYSIVPHVPEREHSPVFFQF